MNIYFAEKLKSLRTEKNISQEKLARYLKVSFQAVSKWETGNTYPDISLLPDIAHFFDVTVDELLCVEKIDEKKLFDEYSEKTSSLFQSGKRADALTLWQEAFKRMPNNIDVKEMLMSSYFDTDITKYFQDFHELATEIYEGEAEGEACAMYYKSQAISQLARAYASLGRQDEAQKWAGKSVPIFNSKEIIEAMIDSGDDLMRDVAFCTYWFLEELFFMACRIDNDNSQTFDNEYKQNCFQTVAQIYETVYKNNDMGFDAFRHLCNLHQGIAEYEAMKSGDESTVRLHLERAAECCFKSMSVKEHKLKHPLLNGWQADPAPDDNKINLRFLSDRLKQDFYDPYRKTEWFLSIESRLDYLLK